MTEQELRELVQLVQERKCEWRQLELKAAHQGCPKKLYDTLSAFSNQDGGGTILFGIDEGKEYEVVGVYDMEDLQKKVNEQCKQMEPVVRPTFTLTVFEDGKGVVSAEIPAVDISERPCCYRGKGRVDGSWVRVGDSDEPMSEYEVYSYEAFRKQLEDDIRPAQKENIQIAIDQEKVKQYLTILKTENPRLSQLSDTDILKFSSLYRENVPSLMCVLMFSNFPQMFYPQYTINATVIPGTERGSVTEDGTRFLDNRRIEGSIPEILESALAFVIKNMKVQTRIDPRTGKRYDKTEYPIAAVREAILNALVHRDYSIHSEGKPIELTMFRDRLELRNPGGLYGKLTIDQLGNVQPDTRNKRLARLLETLKITENRYSGIPTIRRELKEAGLQPPEFADSRSEFRVTFYNEPIEDKQHNVNEQERELLEFCRTPRTRQEIAEWLGVKSAAYAMSRNVKPLLERGLLKMTLPETPKSKDQKFFSE